jgi:hypothetical protein
MRNKKQKDIWITLDFLENIVTIDENSFICLLYNSCWYQLKMFFLYVFLPFSDLGPFSSKMATVMSHEFWREKMIFW